MNSQEPPGLRPTSLKSATIHSHKKGRQPPCGRALQVPVRTLLHKASQPLAIVLQRSALVGLWCLVYGGEARAPLPPWRTAAWPPAHCGPWWSSESIFTLLGLSLGVSGICVWPEVRTPEYSEYSLSNSEFWFRKCCQSATTKAI